MTGAPSLNCASLAAVASSVGGPQRCRHFSDTHRQWGRSGQCQTHPGDTSPLGLRGEGRGQQAEDPNTCPSLLAV